MAGSKLPVPLWAYRRPPAGLTDEWHKNYLALIDPISRVLMFKPDHARQGTCELFKAWLEVLQHSELNAKTVLQFLHGRAHRSWTAGQAIIDAIRPISSALSTAIRFLTSPTPTPRGAEATAKSLQARIADQLNELDATPLLDELAAAVVADCAAQQGRLTDAGTRSNTPKGKPGRRGYPLEALEYAQKLRTENPGMKVHNIRQKCLQKFSEDDLPANTEAFRRWMNRKRANRAN